MSDDTETLFDEASEELEEDIRNDLSDAEENLPPVDAVWSPEGENIIGILNQLQSSVDFEDSIESVKEARKSFLLGEKAGAISDDDAEEFEERISQITVSVDNLQEIDEVINDLIPMFPELKGSLSAIEDRGEDDNGKGESVAESESGVEESEEDSPDDESELSMSDSDESAGSGPAESWGG